MKHLLQLHSYKLDESKSAQAGRQKKKIKSEKQLSREQESKLKNMKEGHELMVSALLMGENVTGKALWLIKISIICLLAGLLTYSGYRAQHISKQQQQQKERCIIIIKKKIKGNKIYHNKVGK